LLRALLSKSTQTEWSPAAMASEVGYTAMTVSRVVSELTHAGVAKLDQRGRARWPLMGRPPAETWELIRPRLRTPIKRQFWARIATAFDQKDAPLAGLSALAHYTQLADPTTPVYAVGVEQLKSPGFKNLSEIPEPVSHSAGRIVLPVIPLKAHAWLDLGERKARGEPVDSKNIRKHANDIIRMSQLLSPESRISAPPKIAEDLGRFLDAVIADDTYSSKSLGFDIPLPQIAERIALAYQLKHA